MIAVTPVRTGPSPRLSAPSPLINVTCPTSTPATSVIAFTGPGLPAKGMPRSRALASAADAVATVMRQLAATTESRKISLAKSAKTAKVGKRDSEFLYFRILLGRLGDLGER